MNSRFIQFTYRQIIAAIQKKDIDLSELAQAILQGALLGEYLTKVALQKINPIAPYQLEYLKRSHADFAALVGGSETSSKLRFEDIGILLDRAKALKIFDDDLADLISKIKTDRNIIMHDPAHEYDKWEAQARLIKLFVNNQELFKKHLSLIMSAPDLDQLKKALAYVENRIANRLDTKIKKLREAFEALGKTDKNARIKEGYQNISADGSAFDNMLCPACKNQTLHYFFAVDHDWNPDGVITTSSTWFECHACGLDMSEYDFDDLYDNPRKYSGLSEPHPTWEEYYKSKDFEENAYEYM